MNSQFRIAVVLVMLSLAASVGSADEVTLSVTPYSLTIQPGSTDNFSYTITNTTGDSVVAEGINQDLVQYAAVDSTPFGYPILDPGPNSATGPLATLTADASAPVGSTISGNFYLALELFDSNPLLNPAAIDLGPLDIMAPYSITVESPQVPATTPEPTTLSLYLTGLLALFAIRNKCTFRERPSMG